MVELVLDPQLLQALVFCLLELIDSLIYWVRELVLVHEWRTAVASVWLEAALLHDEDVLFALQLFSLFAASVDLLHETIWQRSVAALERRE